MTLELAGQAKDFGVAAVLEKPVSPGRLVEVVRVALDDCRGGSRKDR